MNLDELAKASLNLDEDSFCNKFQTPVLIFKPPAPLDQIPVSPDLPTDQYEMTGKFELPPHVVQAMKARESMGSSFILFVRSAKNSPLVTVGRGREADICIPLGNVSRIHAGFSLAQGGHWTVTDNKSTNGTYVNDQRLPAGGTAEVLDGSWVRFGADATTKFFTSHGLFAFMKMYRASLGL